MHHEPQEVRLARIEEGMVRIHDKLDANHRAAMGILQPVAMRVNKHHDDITTLKRDRWWLFTLCSAAFGAALYSLVEIFNIHPRG